MNYSLRSPFILAIACVMSGQMLLAQAVNYKESARLNTVTTAVPFLRINPDARAGGMGDVGLASPADANAVYSNPAKLAFVDKDFGFAVGFSPWLKALVNDIYLANLTGYYKIKKMQTVSLSLRYFSLGNITFTDYNGQELQTFRPQEFAIAGHYARRLGDMFSVAASLRVIYSNLAGGASVDGALVKPGVAGAGDISAYFHKKFNENAAHKMEHDLSVGLNISNIGSKISYTSSTVKDFIPTNLGLGVGYTLEIVNKHSVGFYVDMNKLMVPTPDTADKNRNNVYDFREKSSIGGMFTSFGDAPGVLNSDGSRVKGSRAAEEFAEVTWGIGAEYLYNKQFGVRFGYFYENPKKGNRQFLTAGLTVKYSVVGLNFSYLIPTTIQRNPLDNTLRFTLLFDFTKGGKKSPGETGVSLVDDTPKKKKNKKADSEEVQPVQGQPFQPIENKSGEPK